MANYTAKILSTSVAMTGVAPNVCAGRATLSVEIPGFWAGSVVMPDGDVRDDVKVAAAIKAAILVEQKATSDIRTVSVVI